KLSDSRRITELAVVVSVPPSVLTPFSGRTRSVPWLIRAALTVLPRRARLDALVSVPGPFRTDAVRDSEVTALLKSGVKLAVVFMSDSAPAHTHVQSPKLKT